ncbi:MAG TPA: pyridoxal phosphate-dependent aminotransferase [Candidatus Ligilactobacillus excrementavium]|nr:pyridoxal phosphate-dependent aminotransferase [Candidatus Ligilactobacillus excrementavium]
MKLSKKVRDLQPSATIALSDQAKKLKAKGVDVINLTAGEPDFPTPAAIKDAAITAIRQGQADSYTAASGILPLKKAIAAKVNEQYQANFSFENVAVTTGAKFGLYLLGQALLDPEDEVLIPVPFWVSYGEQVKLAGGKPIFVRPTSTTGKISVSDLEKCLTSKTKLLILNSPQNPSGLVYSKSELLEIAQWATKHELILLTDDIYRDLIYNQTEFHSLFEFGGKIREHTVLVSGFSKSYAMTGWRIGFVVGPTQLIKTLNSLLGQTTSNLTAVSQYAALAALNLPQNEVEQMRVSYEKRLNHFYPKLAELPGFSFPVKPQGAFYFFPDVREALKLTGISSTTEFAAKLLDEAHVALVPGEAFGQPGFIRLTYAADKDSLEESIQRIHKFIELHM